MALPHLLLFVFLPFAFCDISVIQQVFNNSACSGDEMYQLGPSDLQYLSCSAYERSLNGSTGCGLNQCCDHTSGTLNYYFKHTCNDTAVSSSCPTLNNFVDTACFFELFGLSFCPDTTPSTACCSSLLIWEATCSDTSFAKPPFYCAYRPESGTQYYNDMCSDFASGCPAVKSLISNQCFTNGCPDPNPSLSCCTAVRGLNFAGSTCDVPAIDASCSISNVTYDHMLDWCESEFPTPSPSVAPSTNSSRFTVKSCVFDWAQSTNCKGSPSATVCSVQPHSSCAEFNSIQRRDYFGVTSQYCDADQCCSVPQDGKSFMWTCHQDSGAFTWTLLPVLFSSLVLAFIL